MNGPARIAELVPVRQLVPGPVPIRQLLARSRRDVVVDVASLAICAFTPLVGSSGPRFTDVWFDLRIPLVLLAWGLLLIRRRHPLAVALLIIPLVPLSSAIGPAATIALLGLAIRRPLRISLPVAGLDWLIGSAAALLQSHSVLQPWLVRSTIIANLVFDGLIVGVGLFIQMRRTLARTRAEQVEKEQSQRVHQARELERHQIAREMHDVLGHRISLISLHAGALEYRAVAVGPEIASSAAIIRESARQALQDLRQVVGVLRTAPDETGRDDEPRHRPPALPDVDRLVDESRQVGMIIDLTTLADPGSIPETLGRTAYRVIQESLTNARKHAAGATVRITVTSDEGTGLSIEVSNGPGHASATVDPIPGSGYGLVGLAERVQILGGALEHGPTPDGGFRLAARLPWPP
jgi:signal transduction histidine kinase